MNELLIDSEYLIFRQIPFEGKTKRIEVISKSSQIVLGRIMWYPQWRQYTFQPGYPTVWNIGCLKDINKCLEFLKEERKNENR